MSLASTLLPVPAEEEKPVSPDEEEGVAKGSKLKHATPSSRRAVRRRVSYDDSTSLPHALPSRLQASVSPTLSATSRARPVNGCVNGSAIPLRC